MISPRIGAPRARACSYSSSTTMPAPSAITKPSRPRSNGRDAARRVVVAGGQRPHVGERRNGHAGDRPFAAAGEHHVGDAAADQLPRRADGVRARCARRHGREIGPLQVVADRHQPGRDVGNEHRHEERRDPVRALCEEDLAVLLEGHHPADARPEDRTAPRRIGDALIESCLHHRLVRSGDAAAARRGRSAALPSCRCTAAGRSPSLRRRSAPPSRWHRTW